MRLETTGRLHAVEDIPRYEEDFFNCYMGHLLSYLRVRDVPVERVFYKCLEPIQRIYHSFVAHGRDRWHYPSPFFDLHLLGVETVTRRFPAFADAKPEILRLLGEKKAVFFSGDGYYIPHRIETYRIRLQPHNFLLTGYEEGEAGPRWYVQDHARPDFFGWYEENVLRDCYDLADYPFAKYIASYDIDSRLAHRTDLRIFVDEARAYLDMYLDDFTVYERIAAEAAGHLAAGHPEWLIPLERTLFFLASSRELFARFLQSVGSGEELLPMLAESRRLAYAARGQLMRLRGTRRTATAAFEALCRELRASEEGLLVALRDCFLNGVGNLVRAESSGAGSEISNAF
ncbi:hypothetical protein [Gorillibacterium sp. sgz500922]|uniref:hypothetical protein n=1 Tax=Gorillibacterium sp. sgz500922 TaxID=3446694 RepID=UPI003F678BBB